MKRRDCLAALASTVLVARTQAQVTGTPIEWPAIELLDGTTLTPASWQGMAAVVVFWATYCAFCKRHNAHIDKLHRATKGQPVRILAMAEDGNADLVRRYMQSHGYGFPVALSDGVLRRRMTARRIIPMTCVVGRDGLLRQAIPGEMTEDDVMGLAQAALRGVR